MNIDDEQFQRTKALIGDIALEKLFNSKVIVFGVGGVGGHVIEALVRSGVGEIDIVDNDTVSLSNINRQIIALHSTLGKYKVDAMKERILDINPKVKVNAIKVFFDNDTREQFDFSKYNYVIDAIDCVKSKILLIQNAKENNVPIISSMGTGNKLNPAGFIVEDISKTSVCPLARIMRNELKKRGIKNLKVVYSKELPCKNNEIRTPSSNSYVPAAAGLLIASEVIEDIILK